MNSIGNERAFFTQLWPVLRISLEQGGPDALVAGILARDSDAERSALFRFARQGLVFEEWEGKSLDAAERRGLVRGQSRPANPDELRLIFDCHAVTNH